MSPRCWWILDLIARVLLIAAVMFFLPIWGAWHRASSGGG